MLRRITTIHIFVRTNFNLRLAALCIAAMGLLGFRVARIEPNCCSNNCARFPHHKAINYGRKGTTLKILFHGTDLMQQAAGEAKVENKGNRVEIDAKFEGFEEATKFGLEYLTYVLWAVSPQGRAVNLGESKSRMGKRRLKRFPTCRISA